MPAQDVASRLQHRLDAIGEARSFTRGRTYDDFHADPMLRRAVERVIEIVSEASRHVSARLKAKHPDIPRRAVAGSGNILRHTYEVVDEREIWLFVGRDLEPLEQGVRSMPAEVAG